MRADFRSACTALVAAIAACAAACTTAPHGAKPAEPSANRCAPQLPFAAGGERATLWLRTSAEFRASAEGIYRAAEAALALALADRAWTAEPEQTGDFSSLPPAVVMDIDETVLDNSEPQAAMLADGTCFDGFPKAWDDWVAQRSAPAVPGAAEFIRAARDARDGEGRAVRVFFITNRECAPRAGDSAPCPQQDDTAANLESLGLGSATLTDDLMLKGERAEWDSEKLSRRQAVARTHRIVLNVGDDLADFLPAVRRATVTERDRARCAHRDAWGRRWFLVPNPMYGSWLVALGTELGAAIAAAPAVFADCATS
jgi:5'-nucleotidase (lipoprotein e(P4) family)